MQGVSVRREGSPVEGGKSARPGTTLVIAAYQESMESERTGEEPA